MYRVLPFLFQRHRGWLLIAIARASWHENIIRIVRDKTTLLICWWVGHY